MHSRFCLCLSPLFDVCHRFSLSVYMKHMLANRICWGLLCRAFAIRRKQQLCTSQLMLKIQQFSTVHTSYISKERKLVNIVRSLSLFLILLLLRSPSHFFSHWNSVALIVRFNTRYNTHTLTTHKHKCYCKYVCVYVIRALQTLSSWKRD